MECRNTIQRELVLAAVKSLYHPSAEEVYLHVTEKHPTVSKGTVYRNLNVLVENGVLRRVMMPGAADRFDITLSGHYHIQCKVCGRVEDVELPYQVDLISRISDTRGFEIQEHDIILRGICASCNAAEAG